MQISEFETELQRRHPDFQLHKDLSGAATWINIQLPSGSSLTLQITPNDGIGLSKLPRDTEVDFGGHDEVFEDLNDVLRYIDEEWRETSAEGPKIP